MLDDTLVPFQLDQKGTGFDLINLVYTYLKLVESDYFGLEIVDSKGKKTWVDFDKSVVKQLTTMNSKILFAVKFYTPDPGQLEEEYTRYLYALQIKRDLAEGSLLCSDATASLLVSYILQAELGDYLDSYDDSPSYFNSKRYFPHQNEDHEIKIMDYHKNHM
jgi:FERM, RhoGEF and pleckstrin domain protein 2